MKKMNVGAYGRVIAHFDALGETNKIRMQQMLSNDFVMFFGIFISPGYFFFFEKKKTSCKRKPSTIFFCFYDIYKQKHHFTQKIKHNSLKIILFKELLPIALNSMTSYCRENY